MGEDAGDDGAVGLALQRLLVTLQQAAEGERGGGALGQHHVTRRRLRVAEQDQPPPVLAARAHRGDQPAGGRVVRGALGRSDGPGPGLPARQQGARVAPRRLGGQDLVREVLQQHRPARQPGHLGQHLGRRGALDRQLGEDLVQLLGGTQLLKLDVDDAGVHRLGDLHERCLAGEHDDRQPVLLRRLDHDLRQLAHEPAAQLNDQPGGADGGELADVVGELVGVFRQGHARGEHQLAAAEQLGDVGDLADVHPPHLGVEPVGARDHARAAPAHGLQSEDVGDGGEHGPSLSDQPVRTAEGRLTVCQPCQE